MNTKILFVCAAALAFVGCSSDDIADNVNPGGNTSTDETQVPVTFNTHKGNITRAGDPAGLETLSYNFGTYAYKVNGSNSVPIMGNFLVGYSQDATSAGNDAKGYDHSKSSTWASDAGTNTDHKSPWFYDGLGSSEYSYSGTAGYLASSNSANAIQPLVYWDKAYTSTEFDAYAPYANDATFDYDKKVLTLPTSSAKDLLVAKTSSTNANGNDVTLSFKHIDSEVRLAFCSDVPNYRVQIVDLQGDGATKATFPEGTADGDKTGIVATPATVSGTTYSKGSYDAGGTITVNYTGADPAVSFTNGTTSSANLHFALPEMTAWSVTKLGSSSESTFNVIPKAESGYTYTDVLHVTPTQSNSTGFTFHVTFKLISEVTGEELTVYNAKVYVPADAATWGANTLNTYRFKITANALGSTSPATEIDPNGVDPTGDKALVPIVFDGATVDAYQEAEEVNHDYDIN